jgi:hypothetical protein
MNLRRAILGALFRVGCCENGVGGSRRAFDFGALAAARRDRLEGAAGVDFAVWKKRHLGAAAEVEFRRLRIADRPAAAALGQRLDRFALGERDLDFHRRRHVSFGVHVKSTDSRVARLCEARLYRSLGIGHAGARPMRFHP